LGVDFHSMLDVQCSMFDVHLLRVSSMKRLFRLPTPVFCLLSNLFEYTPRGFL
jgi:hypothetical protein